jgi:hypothetical protein
MIIVNYNPFRRRSLHDQTTAGSPRRNKEATGALGGYVSLSVGIKHSTSDGRSTTDYDFL